MGVNPVRAFRSAAPEEGISLVGPDGPPSWCDRSAGRGERAGAKPDPRHLRRARVLREIEALEAVASFSTPSTWTVKTDRGPATFVLKTEDDIRRLKDGRLLITSSHGLQFTIRDRFELTAIPSVWLDRVPLSGRGRREPAWAARIGQGGSRVDGTWMVCSCRMNAAECQS